MWVRGLRGLFHALDPAENEDAHEDLIGNALMGHQRLQFFEGALVEGHPCRFLPRRLVSSHGREHVLGREAPL